MAFKKAWALSLACLLATSGCSAVIGDHPFSSSPSSSGKLDKKPNVLILRGQDYLVCGENGKPLTLKYFVHLRWMPPQALWVENPGKGEVELFGKEFSISVNVTPTAGYLTYVTTKFRTAKQSFEMSTTLLVCNSVSVESKWTTGDTASGDAGVAAGF